MKRIFTDCVDLVGSSCKNFGGTKWYVSTGALDEDHINESDIEIVDYDSKPSRANLSVSPGDVIFAKMQATKKTLLIDDELSEHIYSTGFCAVRAKKDKLTERCLLHLLTSDTFLSQKDKNCSGATQKAITNSGLEKIIVNLPDYDQQDEIAEQLDKVTNIIKMRKDELRCLDDLIKARFVELFGDPVHNPRNWDMVTFDDCLMSIENGKSFVCDSGSREGEQPAILKLSAATYGVYKPEENKAIINENDFIESAEVHDGDLLFTRKNTPELVGMAAYVETTPKRLMMPDLIFRLNTNSSCNKIYMWKLINHDLYRGQIESAASGSAKSMSNISKERLGKLKLPLPPIEVQEQFADFVKQVDKSKVVE